jgi:hypothetical protein
VLVTVTGSEYVPAAAGAVRFKLPAEDVCPAWTLPKATDAVPENPDGNWTCPVTATAVKSPLLVAVQLNVNCDPAGIEAGRLHDGARLGPETEVAGLLKAAPYGSEVTPLSDEVAISTFTTASPV